MTSSTTRAFMAKKQSTSFAQVATNLLNVLQGYTKSLRLLLVMFLTLTASTTWGAEVTVNWTASSGALGSGIGNGTIKTGTFSWNYTRTLISGSSYTGWSSNCIQLGKNGGVENITFTTSAIPGTIKSVSVECSSYNNAHKVSIKVGNNTYLSSTATAKWTTISTKTGSGTSSGQIVISFTDGSRALYIKSISVTYEEAAATVPVTGVSLNKSSLTLTEGDSETLTATVLPNNATDKTITWSTSNSSVATVSDGKVTAVAEGSATITVTTTDGGKTATCDVTVNPKPKYTVTWDVNGDQSVTTQVTEGSKPTFPATPSSCDATSNTFYGWATATWDGKIDDINGKTIYTSANEMPEVNGALTYYAVFAKKETSGSGTAGWGKVTSTDDLEAGAIYAISSAATEGTYLSTYANGNNFPGSASVICPLILGGSAGAWTFQINDGSTYDKRYLTATSTTSSNHLKAVASVDQYSYFSVSFSNGAAVITCTGKDSRNILRKNSSSSLFACYSSGQSAVYLQKYSTGSTTTYSNYITSCTTETSYSVTIADNIENGEVTANPTSATAGTEIALTATPTNGYQFSSWIVTKEGGGTVEVTNNKFTMPASNVTVSATFEALPTYSIQWLVNSEKAKGTPTTSVIEGQQISNLPTTPTSADCDGVKEFVGWTDEEIIGISATAPTNLYIELEDFPAITKEKIFYAVFANVEVTGTGEYVKVTKDLLDYSGEYLIVYEAGSRAFNGGLEESLLDDNDNYISITISDNVVQATDAVEKARFIMAKVDGGYSIQSASGLYIGRSANDKGMEIAQTYNENLVNTFPNCSTIRGKGEVDLQYNNSTYPSQQNRFRYYASSLNTIALYKKTGTNMTNYTTSCVPTYTITWQNDDGTVLETDKVAENTTPTYDGSTPTKAATEQYTYTFNGWDPAIAPATTDATYTATYTATVNKYTITWKNGETTLETDNNVPYGEMPTYNGETPTKAATAQYTYTFNGWSPEVTSVTGDATYTATFTETLRTYTITWKNDDGTTLKTDENVPYGTTPSYDGEEPTKTATAQHSYNFNGWSPEVTSVTGDATYTAKYTAIVNIIWMVNGKQKNSTTAPSGASVTPPDVNPIPCGAVLAGWTDAENGEYVHDTSTLYEGAKPSIKVTENKTFYAVFADLEGAVPEMPTVIAYWSAKEITTSEMNADEGIGRMKSNIALSTESSTGKSYYKDLGQNGTTKPVITLSNLNLTTSSNVCFSFWARGSSQGNLTVKTNLSDEAIATFKLTTKEALYVLENIPTTATSIVITYEVMTGTFFFGTVKFYEAPEIYSFEKLTAENTNGWTGSDWDGYYLITDADTKALDGNAIGEYSNQRVEEVDNKIECSITTAFHIIYNSEENGYSVQGVGDGDYLQQGSKTITVSSTAVYLPAISYNSLKGTDNYELQWNGDKCAFYASAQSAPQMYKIMSELSNPRTLCEYEVTWLVGGEEYIAGTPTTTVQAGKTITTLPTNPTDNALGCCSDKFMGWTTSTAKTIENQYLYETIEEIQEKFPSIYEDLTFRAVFATAAQGVGTSIADFSEMGYENGTAVIDPIVLGDGEGHGDATITLAKAPSSKNDAKYYDDGGAVRVYAGSTITISSTYDGATIKSVTFEFSASDTEGDNTISVTSGDGTYSEGTWTGDATAVTFTIGGSTRHRRIASITVTTGVAGSQYTNYVTSCDKMNDPSLGAVQLTYKSGDAIAVNCGTLSSKNSAASITFPNAVNLTCPITVTAPAGFVLATNKQSDTYTQTVVIKPVKTAGENKGKITKTVYVRADAPENSETDYSSNITIAGEEITETTVTVKADVTCKTYTFKTLTHIGDEHTSNTYYAGQTIEEAPVEPVKDACSENYTFDGWSTSEVEYGSLIYNKVSFPYTMPAKDVILYPVYQVNTTADYHRVTSDLGDDNWAGDYLIAANNDEYFAIGLKGGTSDVECIGGENSAVTTMKQYVVNNTISYIYGDPIHVTMIAVENGYVLQTQDGIYNYIRNSEKTGLNVTSGKNTAAEYPLTISFDKESHNVSIANLQTTNKAELRYTGSRFGFYDPTKYNPIYLYKKSPLYTTSLICGTIETEATPMVTSTAGQTVKVNVPITLTASLGNNTTITGTSDNAAFTVTALNDITAGVHTIAVNYTPTKTTDGIETANITLKASAGNNASTTFQVTGRHLPENFVIAAKWGDNWYALPANCVKSSDSKQGILIDVDDINNPTSATAPTTTKYGLRGVKPGRQADFGQSILFTERVSDNQQRALFQNSGETENIWVSAQYENYDGSNPTYYEWIPSTNDLTNYTFTHSASSRKLGVNENGVFGAYTTDVQVRLLPATFYEQVAVQVIKWKANSVIVMYTGAETTATTQVGTNAATADQTLANQKITHGIYELTTNQSLTANAGKILTMCFGTTQVKVEVPLIVSEEVIASANGHDVVILNGGKLTAAETSYAYNNIYVYGGGKLAIPEGAQLGVNNIILRAGGVATNDAGQEATYQYIYPQVDLKGTLTAASQTFLKYEYVTDYDHWYHLVLPFNASLSTITYPQEYYGENVKADNKGSWQIKRYAGEIRATGNYDAWKDIETEGATSTTAGKGYIFWGAPKKVTIGGDTQRQKWGIQRFTLGKTPSVAISEEKSNKKISDLSSYATVEGNSGADNDQGWNLVGNPYMVNLTGLNSQSLQIGQLIHETDASGNWTGKWHWDDTSETTGLRYVTIPSDHFDTYTAGKMTETELVAGRSFFVQIAGDATDLVFDVNKKASLMPALLAENSDKPVDIETGIVLSNETLQDEMNFWIKDGKTNDYEYNADYPKTPNNNHFNIYGVHTNGDLSWVAISPEFAAESMPIGYQVPAAGTYTLSLSETYYSEDLQALYVTDHGVIPEVTTDLLSGSYDFSVNQAETNNERFTVSIILKTEEDDGGGDVSTGVDNTTNNNTPCKFIYQDKMYILQNGVIYDAMGKQVKTINK